MENVTDGQLCDNETNFNMFSIALGNHGDAIIFSLFSQRLYLEGALREYHKQEATRTNINTRVF